MIEMSCPSCGAGGRVPRNKMNARMVCKKCLRVFYLTPSGKAVLGEPPPQKEAPAQRAPRERMELDAGELFDDLGSKFSKIKLPQPRTIAIIAAVILVGAGIAWFMGRQSVEMRTQTLAKAIKDNDIAAMMEMVLPGTEMEAMKWTIDICKQYGNLKLNLGGMDPGVKISVQGDSKGAAAQSLVVFSSEGARGAYVDIQAPTSTSKQSIEVVLYWALDGWGNWRLDAKKTTEAAGPST